MKTPPKIYYAGIGSRETPADVLELMSKFAIAAARRGWVLRSGGADGADMAFQKGCESVGGEQVIYLPWRGFNGHRNVRGERSGVCDMALRVAAEYHPNWAACSQGAQKMHARNVYQVIGDCFDEPVKLVVCWTKGATGAGGTGQAIRIAKKLNIPVYDLADAGSRKKIEESL